MVDTSPDTFNTLLAFPMLTIRSVVVEVCGVAQANGLPLLVERSKKVLELADRGHRLDLQGDHGLTPEGHVVPDRRQPRAQVLAAFTDVREEIDSAIELPPEDDGDVQAAKAATLVRDEVLPSQGELADLEAKPLAVRTADVLTVLHDRFAQLVAHSKNVRRAVRKLEAAQASLLAANGGGEALPRGPAVLAMDKAQAWFRCWVELASGLLEPDQEDARLALLGPIVREDEKLRAELRQKMREGRAAAAAKRGK